MSGEKEAFRVEFDAKSMCLESLLSLCLEARQLACERDDRWLFQGLDLTIRSGEIVRIEGPNGSGKTTLLKILSGQLGDYQGELFWNGAAMKDAREHFLANLLYLGHAPGIKAGLTPLENLAWYQALSGKSNQDSDNEESRLDALANVGLAGFEDVPAGQLSAGQQRRVALARLTLTPRALWVLDEPFTAIDRYGVAALEQQLVAHAQSGGCVLVTTHHELTASPLLRRIALA
ncbi:hypothetical protein LCGC14_0154850 [marine sediment metagenome]|uniref:ABC transporter domain-containing protein n=1 Tax=marine sediment metagenome TaxID=412755 RepID=A0A0F9XZ60_9ZZZZ